MALCRPGFITVACLVFTLPNVLNAQGTYDRGSNPSRGYSSQKHSPCEQSSCYPATGNLLIGRENRLFASSTCGLNSQQRYCIVSHLEERKKCFWCDSRPQNKHKRHSHRIENIVYGKSPVIGGGAWWQSENGVENVSIQLDLEAEFHFTHMIITFKTFRPAAMLIERSYDFGKTWQVYRYFAHKCEESFPGISRGPQRNLTDVVCDSRYSDIEPVKEGEIIMRVLPPNLHHLYDDPYSQEVQNLLKMTNLRINFTKLHTLGDDKLDKREEIQEKYYYAISEMVVRGSCSCYGHASRCLPLSGHNTKQDMVHGRCECTHNTKGLNCESCEDFFNDLPWKPAIGKQTNACKRCNCNNHATSCHFDPDVYEKTGRISGGVCDGCQHNTVGRNCELCKPFYYRDPDRDFSDPEVCKLCNCDIGGSLDQGICDSYTDPLHGLVSGRCKCKANVQGQQCNECKNGFWNFDENNPNGCQECTCNTLGTIDNEGCNVLTGDCTCKRYVTGRDCNQCLPEYYGLSEDPDGCKPCECDMGGSFDNQCDVVTGQCRCRPYLSGRTCSTPEQTYFAGQLDLLLYEGELANCTNNCQIEIREPYRDGQHNTWSGPGFMRAFPNTDMEFPVNNIQTSMDYVIVIRYEPKVPGNWKDVEVIVERPRPVDPNGPCANSQPQDDTKRVTLPENETSVTVHPPVCLEAGQSYKIRLSFKHWDNQQASPSASILIDSIVLLPRIESIPFFMGSPANENRRREYEHYNCGSAFYTVVKGYTEDVCKKYHYSISYYVHGGAFSCSCDPTGAKSNLCVSLGGNCVCKQNVVGRRCDMCAPGTYGFGPEGCQACDCDSVGALDNFCDDTTGQCKCQAQTYGRACDQCQPGSWNYPKCQRCHCNGHADICDPQTGACIDCREATLGHYCERCINGYYGDPRLSAGIPCRPCPCPGPQGSGHSYAENCQLDPNTQDVICECDDGYAGSRCDVCADNYYGNPEIVGGSCQACNCNNNIDIARPGNCDEHTGQCLQCLFNTEGYSCEVCKAGYYGDALQQSCRECVCDFLGTDQSQIPCNHITGQCPCLPNVTGQSCDLCVENHWKIASGTGCEPCACDPIGSSSEGCNQFDGQCDCKPGFGGRQCNQCQTNHWGDPNVHCQPCECNPEGSATLQCNQQDGSCVCIRGIGGHKCDQCARGFLGSTPQCSPCGECFDNWDLILTNLTDQTNKVIEAAKEIKRTGATGAYTQQFEATEKKLGDINQILKNTTKSSLDLGDVEKRMEMLKNNVTLETNNLTSVGKLLENTTQRIYLSNLNLEGLRQKAEVLKSTAEALKDNATKLQESNVEGALNLTREAAETSKRISSNHLKIHDIINDAERQCRRTENLFPTPGVGQRINDFDQSVKKNKEMITQMNEELEKYEDEIPTLNDLVCDKRGDPCDVLCGGAGCKEGCGGISCEKGAAQGSRSALSFAKDAETHIREKETKAEEIFRGMIQAKQETETAKNLAQQAFDISEQARNTSEKAVKDSSDLMQKLNEFLNSPRAAPADIRKLAQEAKSKNIQLQPEQISDLAQSINKTVSSLTDINKILAETADDLKLAKDYKQKADEAKKDAEHILETAQNVVGALDEAKEAQDKAEVAVQTAKENIDLAKTDLTQITSETAVAQQKANETLTEVNGLQGQVQDLQKTFLKNEKDAREVADEALSIDADVQKTQNKAKELQNAYREAKDKLNKRSQDSGLARSRAQMLLERANQLSVNTTQKLKELQDAETMYKDQEKLLKSLNDDIEELSARMVSYLMNMTTISDHYRNCLH
uniref:Laminin subunit beta-2 n=1 Tax=Clastoptera arizonana TaxID=38151 RepID=A0A1B6DHB4_9HEMI